ncbi:MAG: Ig-like domain-containing protein, partial [Candidatus Sulfotelmatobacter sp.]
MRRYSNSKIWFPAFLLLAFATGCSDYDKPGANPTVTAPTVSSVAPLDAASGACSSTIVTATFSAAMNPASIDG